MDIQSIKFYLFFMLLVVGLQYSSKYTYVGMYVELRDKESLLHLTERTVLVLLYIYVYFLQLFLHKSAVGIGAVHMQRE